MATGLKVDDSQGIVAAYKKLAVARKEFDALMLSPAVVSAEDEAKRIVEAAGCCSKNDVATYLQKVNRAVFGRCVTKTLKLFSDGRRTIFLSKEYGFVVSYTSRAQVPHPYQLTGCLSYAFVTQRVALLEALRSCGEDAYNSRAVKDVALFVRRVETFAGFVSSLLGSDEQSGERVLVSLPIPASEVSLMRSRYGGGSSLMVDVVRVRTSGGGVSLEMEGVARNGGRLREVLDAFALVQLRQMGVLSLLADKVGEVAKRYRDDRAGVAREFEKELLTEAI